MSHFLLFSDLLRLPSPVGATSRAKLSHWPGSNHWKSEPLLGFRFLAGNSSYC